MNKSKYASAIFQNMSLLVNEIIDELEGEDKELLEKISQVYAEGKSTILAEIEVFPTPNIHLFMNTEIGRLSIMKICCKSVTSH